jgi:hypothetical protein
MTDLTARQIARNRETRSQPSFASHREHVMWLIAEALTELTASNELNHRSDDAPTLTVFGPGNCQDIDLAVLATQFCEIRLVDIDGDAVDNAISKLERHVARRIHVSAPCDIASPLMELEGFDGLAEDQQTANLAAIESTSFPRMLPVSDIVVSTCILSQLIDSAIQLVAPDSSNLLPLIQAVRRGHLTRMLNLTAHEGCALLITDLVSSDTVPDLKTTPPAELPDLMFRCLQSGNFFSGLNPAVVQHDLQHHPACVELCTFSRIFPPWHWHLGPRCFAVYAARMVRSSLTYPG